MAEKIIQTIYGGEVEVTFYPNSHRYRVDGERVSSVTTIIGQLDKSRFLVPWATRIAYEYLLDIPLDQRTDEELMNARHQHKEKKEEAGSLGSEVHERIENWIKDQTLQPPSDERVYNAIMAFLDWKDQHDVEFIVSEKFMYSRKHKYVGLCDLIARIDGKKYACDFKTSNGFYKDATSMQLSGYADAYEEEHGEKLDGIMGLHLDKETGEFTFHDLTPYWEEASNCFKLLVQHKHARKAFDKILK